MDKRELIVIGFLFIVLIFLDLVSCLGVSPAIVSMNFQPDFEYTFVYSVRGIAPNRVVEISLLEDLAEYATLDKNRLNEDGNFNLDLKLPKYIEKPGVHRVLVSVKEVVNDTELVGGFIGTAMEIRVIISVYVPYPGKYLEIELESENANLGEPVKFELDLVNRGVENLTFTPQIEIMPASSDEKIETLYFQERTLVSGERIELQKFLDTSDYNPGFYNAVALVDYGQIAKDESKFKIGYLSIEILNYTKKIMINKLQKFDIDMRSSWNDKIDGAYAEVIISNESKNIVDFKTTSTNLNPWENRTITGYFETSNFTKGIYDVDMTVYYYGKDTGKSLSESGKIEFVDKPGEVNYLLIAIIISVVIAIVVLYFLLRKYFFKNGK